MITMITHVRVPPANAAAFEALMQDVCAGVRATEPRVPYYAFAKSVETPDTYVVLEVYEDVAAHAAHMASEIVKTSLPLAGRLIEGGFDIKQYISPGAEPVRR